ncbi:hypothetical protein H5410_038208, partial [Solanum commersonii]
MFWGCQKYSSGNGCGFFRWAAANDSTCQEQYNIKNPPTSSRQGRQGSDIMQPALGPAFTLDWLLIAAFVKSEVAAFSTVEALATLVPATTFEIAAFVPAALAALATLATIVPAATFFYKYILKSK